MVKLKTCAFIGLGVMGYPMAGHLAAKGYKMKIYNRTQAKAKKWSREHKGMVVNSPAKAATDTDFVFTCVGNDDDIRSVLLGKNGAFSCMKAGSTLIDHTTTSASVARELYGIAKEKKIGFLDSPVSGGQAGAEKGLLSVMVGGDKKIFEKTKPIINSYAKLVVRLGKSGSGQLGKMVNQICIAGLLQALAEGLNFAKKAGLNGDQVLEVISKGAAQSWQMENRGRTMLGNQFDFGFSVDWMRKDLGICFNEANSNGALLPITAIVDQFYKQVQQQGGNRLDTSSLILPLKMTNGF